MTGDEDKVDRAELRPELEPAAAVIRYRDERGLAQADLARLLGCDPASVSGLESMEHLLEPVFTCFSQSDAAQLEDMPDTEEVGFQRSAGEQAPTLFHRKLRLGTAGWCTR